MELEHGKTSSLPFTAAGWREFVDSQRDEAAGLDPVAHRKRLIKRCLCSREQASPELLSECQEE